MTGSVEIRPATAERWPDIVTVFGPRGGDPSWCWCQLFLRAALPQPEEARDNRAALCQEVRQAAVPPGLLAYRDGRPVGWTRVTPVTELPGILGNRAIARVLPRDTAGIWWVACFAIQNRHRRSGVGRALLDAAVGFARDHRATTLLAHPVDVSALRASHVSGAALYTGTMAMFSGAGFAEVARTYPSRPVMRISL